MIPKLESGYAVAPKNGRRRFVFVSWETQALKVNAEGAEDDPDSGRYLVLILQAIPETAGTKGGET